MYISVHKLLRSSNYVLVTICKSLLKCFISIPDVPLCTFLATKSVIKIILKFSRFEAECIP